MTSEQIYRRFRGLYKEPGSRFFDTTWAIELINDSVDDIETEIGPLNPEYFGTKSGNLGTPSTNGGYVFDQQEYDLPIDYRKAISILVKDRGGPPYPHLIEIQYWMKDHYFSPDYLAVDWLTAGGKGEPYFYYVHQPATGLSSSGTSKIGFVPIPTRNGASGGVEIIYHSQRANLTEISPNQIPDIPPDWHGIIAHKMAMNAAALDERPNFGYYQAQYQGRLARLLGEGLRGRGESQERSEVIDLDW